MAYYYWFGSNDGCFHLKHDTRCEVQMCWKHILEIFWNWVACGWIKPVTRQKNTIDNSFHPNYMQFCAFSFLHLSLSLYRIQPLFLYRSQSLSIQSKWTNQETVKNTTEISHHILFCLFGRQLQWKKHI